MQDVPTPHPSRDELRVCVDDDGERCLITLAGALDDHNMAVLGQLLREVFNHYDTDVVLDVSALSSMHHAVIPMIVNARRGFRSAGGDLLVEGTVPGQIDGMGGGDLRVLLDLAPSPCGPA